MRKTIYIRDGKEHLWDEVEASAEAVDRAVGWYLLDCHRRCKEMDDEVALQRVDEPPLVPKDGPMPGKKPKPVKSPAKLTDAVGQEDTCKVTTTASSDVVFNPQPKHKDRKGK